MFCSKSRCYAIATRQKKHMRLPRPHFPHHSQVLSAIADCQDERKRRTESLFLRILSSSMELASHINIHNWIHSPLREYLGQMLSCCSLYLKFVDFKHKITAVSIYRLTFHPLAKYPGPLLSKLSNWSIVIQAASGNRHLESWKEHETYGEPTVNMPSWLRH